jgi:hypothetical protein
MTATRRIVETAGDDLRCGRLRRNREVPRELGYPTEDVARLRVAGIV